MNDGILHEATEPHTWLPTRGRLMSLLDILGGGTATCDLCKRWQSFSALAEPMAVEQLSEHGWTFPDGKEICPKCSKHKPSE